MHTVQGITVLPDEVRGTDETQSNVRDNTVDMSNIARLNDHSSTHIHTSFVMKYERAIIHMASMNREKQIEIGCIVRPCVTSVEYALPLVDAQCASMTVCQWMSVGMTGTVSANWRTRMTRGDIGQMLGTAHGQARGLGHGCPYIGLAHTLTCHYRSWMSADPPLRYHPYSSAPGASDGFRRVTSRHYFPCHLQLHTINTHRTGRPRALNLSSAGRTYIGPVQSARCG